MSALVLSYQIPAPERLFDVQSWVVSAGGNFPTPPYNKNSSVKVEIHVRPRALPKLPAIPGWQVPAPTSYLFEGSTIEIVEGKTEIFVGIWKHPGQSRGVTHNVDNKLHGVVQFKGGFKFLIPQDKMHRVQRGTEPALTDPPNDMVPGLFRPPPA